MTIFHLSVIALVVVALALWANSKSRHPTNDRIDPEAERLREEEEFRKQLLHGSPE
jgi:hypothetical protein